MAGPRLPRPVIAMVTDSQRSSRSAGEAIDALVSSIRRAAQAGVDLIQIRERAFDDRRLLELANRVRQAVSGSLARVLVNDRVDVALTAGAAGVHLPGHGVSAARVRAMVPDGFVIGRSVHSEADALQAEREGGCDYLVFGSVFATPSKPAGYEPAGLQALSRVCSVVRLPVLAIGGITLERAEEVAQAGAAGIAAIGLFASGDQDELVDTVRRLRLALGARSTTARGE
jgi:thiamine-phosphate pyrophosphorylase